MLCSAVFVCTAPGRISFPDDEIVFQTTRSLWERGDLEVEGIAKRTGEPKGRPTGTFGWAHGTDGKRYGFFGHPLSIAALPAYGLGKAMAARAPEAWRHAIRSDHFWVHPRSQVQDWTRLVVSLTNTVVTAAAAWMLVVWLCALGFGLRASVLTGLMYAFGTSAWTYSRTFLSEPLSALVLLAAATAVAHFHRGRSTDPIRASRWLWVGGALAGLSVQVHVLNLVAIPAFVGYAMVPLWREGSLQDHRRAWQGALALGAAGLLLLGLSHHARFGDALETGRYGLYSHFIVPGRGLVALVVAPGRSVLLYSPAIVIGLWGAAAFARRAPAAAWFAAALVLTRLVFVATRSDWWGGWAVGPRFLVPAIPFCVAPLAAMFAGWGERSRRRRLAIGVGLALCVALSGHLALYSIFEWMTRLTGQHTDALPYLTRSHWFPSASPIVGFWQLRTDVLLGGAVRLARFGHPGLMWLFVGVGAVAVVSAVALARGLRDAAGHAGPRPQSGEDHPAR